MKLTISIIIDFHNLSKLVAPQITPFNFGDETLNAGETVSSTCTVNKGDLPLKIFWVFNDNEINPNDGITVSKNGKRISMLSIDSIQAKHKGNYTCVAINMAGKVNHTAYLFVNGIQQTYKY